MTTDSGSYSRREFLSSGAVLVGSAVLAACESQLLAPVLDEPGAGGLTAGSLYLFGEESGQFPRGSHFVLGLVQTGDAATQRGALLNRRVPVEMRLNRDVQWSSTDRKTAATRLAWIQYFFEATTTDLQFSAVVTDATRMSGLTYLDAWRFLLTETVASGTGVSLQLERRSSGGGEQALIAALKAARPGLMTNLVTNTGDDLQQLADLLTGAIRADLTRARRGRAPAGKGKAPAGGPSPRNAIKDQVISELKQQLGVPRLTHPRLSRRTDFNVKVLRPPF